ncbi:MAG: DUF928 domain-containing protein [Pseudanabaenaceae cyanobacterium SKYGB_i_bin29]|nr:DUF928 domain-containing protein [Pseudanabaenaceae cyanobacterium SKYG29]MDW8421654.1 DUF928 domain-containing protein [Pseudanabaenaceae cyanobacterium SKYGB_i_bin29]
MKNFWLFVPMMAATIGLILPLPAQENEPTSVWSMVLGRSAPGGRRKGAASRGCSPQVTPIALVPDPAKAWALTSSPTPRFWFYLPQLPPQIRSAEFVLQDTQDNDIYRTTISLTGKAGLVRVAVPNVQGKTLDTGRTYRWTFQVPCEQNSWVVLESHTGRDTEGKTTPWLDKVDTVASQVVANPQNVEARKAWLKLLQELELPELAKAPL